MDILNGTFEERLRISISFAWKIFSEQVGSGLLKINKEASMQLHYAYILQQVLPLVCFNHNQTAHIELETGEKIENKSREIDLVLIGLNEGNEYKIAVEMKCYKEFASSGGKRGATDIFMKDVYEDLHLLESYCEHAGYDKGVALVMNDLKRLVYPKKKDAKCWDYDISNNTKISNRIFTTPIGGKDINMTIKKSYDFIWEEKNNFWFLENEGI